MALEFVVNLLLLIVFVRVKVEILVERKLLVHVCLLLFDVNW
jgi:hypothetical protein